LVTDGLATSANGDFNTIDGPIHGRARASVTKAAGTQIETVFINPSTQTPDLVTYMNDLSTSGTHHLVGDFDQLGETVSNIAYNIACTTEVLAPGASPPVTPPPTPPAEGYGYCNYGSSGTGADSTCDGNVQGGEWCNANQNFCETCVGKWCVSSNPLPTPAPTPAPTQPTGGPYHCNECETCTDTVWSTWVGEGNSWYPCGDRVAWIQSSKSYSLQEACNYVTAEYPGTNGYPGCPCDCNSDIPVLDCGLCGVTGGCTIESLVDDNKYCNADPALFPDAAACTLWGVTHAFDHVTKWCEVTNNADCAYCGDNGGCAISSQNSVKYCNKDSNLFPDQAACDLWGENDGWHESLWCGSISASSDTASSNNGNSGNNGNTGNSGNSNSGTINGNGNAWVGG